MTSSLAASEQQKLFRCYKPINPYDPTFQQGKEKFLDIFIFKDQDNAKSLSFDLFDMSGSLNVLPSDLTSKPTIGSDFTTFSSHWEGGFVSMVFLGANNWGAHLEHGGYTEEFMCQELIRLEDL